MYHCYELTHLRKLLGNLDVLLLIIADRHVSALVQEYVSALEHWIHIQPEGNFLQGGALLSELGQPRQCRHRAQAAQYPREFRVFGHPRLLEQNALVGVQAAAEQRGRHVHGVFVENRRILGRTHQISRIAFK